MEKLVDKMSLHLVQALILAAVADGEIQEEERLLLQIYNKFVYFPTFYINSMSFWIRNQISAKDINWSLTIFSDINELYTQM